METLERGGVTVDSIKKELIPVPGRRQFHDSTRAVARAVVYDFGTYAGIIDEADYQTMNESGGRFLPGVYSFAKDQFRILGRTNVVAGDSAIRWHVLAADPADAQLTQAVRSFLLDTGQANPSLLRAVGIARFVSAESSERHSRRDPVDAGADR